jgi:hypothetical protein
MNQRLKDQLRFAGFTIVFRPESTVLVEGQMRMFLSLSAM